jgi:hypothetical protein
MRRLLWSLTIAGAAIGVFVAGAGLNIATGAPQEAVYLILGVALTVIPYCTARAWDELSRKD